MSSLGSRAQEGILSLAFLMENGGIVTHMTRGEGFSGRIKMRPEDFLVNEIDMSGQVLSIQEGDSGPQRFIIPPLEQKPSGTEAKKGSAQPAQAKQQGDKSKGEGDQHTPSASTEGHAAAAQEAGGAGSATATAQEAGQEKGAPLTVDDMLPPEALQALEEFAASQHKNPPSRKSKEKAQTLVVPMGEYATNKEGRSQLHRCIKERWPFLKTCTVKGEGDRKDDNFVKAEYDLVFEAVGKLLTPEDLYKLQVFVAMSADVLRDTGAAGSKGPCVRLAFGSDKQTRTQLHQCVSRTMSFLQSTTEKQDDSDAKSRDPSEAGKGTCVKLYRKPSKREHSKKRGRDEKGNEVGNWYCAFILEKNKRETLEAVMLLAEALRVPPSDFSWNGTKDKIGITVQRFCVKNVRPERLRNVCIPGLRVGQIEETARRLPLYLGDLKGNRFELCVRDVKVSKEVVDAAVKGLSEAGFLNYYGTQRVGVWNAEGNVSHRVGACVLRGDMEGAVKMLLKSQGDNREGLQEALDVFEKTQDPGKALKMLPNGCRVHQLIFKALQRNGVDAYEEALRAVPRNARAIYVQSYQSFVFNCMVSVRVEVYGKQPVVGDLVLDGSGLGDDNEELVASDDFLLDAGGGEDGQGGRGKRAKLEEGGVKREGVKVLSQDDVDSGKFTIFDVVLPLPGKMTVYPENGMREHYQDALARDGIDIDKPYPLVSDFSGSLNGTYRRIAQSIQNLKADFVPHPPPLPPSNDGEPVSQSGENVVKSEGDRRKDEGGRALKLTFDLPKGVYATMALWELMKQHPLEHTQRSK